MNKKELFDFYEKMYFHEIEVREKISGRIQIPLAIIVSLIGALSYLFQNFDTANNTNYSKICVVVIALSIWSLLLSIYFFIRSWFWTEYEFLPAPEETKKYVDLLEETYSPYQKSKSYVERYLRKYLQDTYIRCTTNNTKTNDKRSIMLHRTNALLIITAILMAVSYSVYYFGDLDKSKNAKPVEVNIINPVSIKGKPMTEPSEKQPFQNQQKPVQPPPPPPPPQPRLIKEGVEVVKPKQEKNNGK